MQRNQVASSVMILKHETAFHQVNCLTSAMSRGLVAADMVVLHCWGERNLNT